MLASYAVGLIAIAVLAAGWLAVQQAWLRSFPDASEDCDALAGRLGCAGCGSANECERGRPAAPRQSEEDTR